MRADDQRKDSGFTLIEVLVALVVTAMLLAIVMNAALAAKERAQASRDHEEAVLLAASLIEERKLAPFAVDPAGGAAEALSWQVTEKPIARDPRGFFVLSRIEARITNAQGRTVYQVSTRKLKPVPAS